MATVKREQPAQEPSNLQSAVAAHHLDTLQSTLNTVFLSSGRFIKEHQSGGGTGRMRLDMQRCVPGATARFQDSLDQLENEVRIAQAVLRRDLALLKQDRKRKLEAAAKQQEAEKARLAAQSRNTSSGGKVEETRADKTNPPVQTELPLEKEPEKQNGLEESLKKEEGHVPAPIDTTTAPTEERDPLFDGTPTTANPTENEFDFDAMFGDSMDTSGDNQQNDMMDTSNDLGFDFDEGPSLLRGLEDFANSGDDKTNTAQNPTNTDIDIAMPDLPDTTKPLTEQPAPAVKAEEQPSAMDITTTSADTTNNPTTDATKVENKDTTNNDTTTEDDMGMMVTDNIEDLFNMDDYTTNPTDSAFDDAFFDFGS